MNIFGKVLTWMIVVFAATGTVLMARAIETRNSWTKQVEKLRDENHRLAEDVATKRQKAEELTTEFERITLGWEGVWSPRPGGVADPQQASFRAGVGKNDGFGVPESPVKPLLYVFQPVDQAGNYRYIGEFQLVNAFESQSVVVPTWNVRPSDIALWQPSNSWRYRRSVPSGYRTRFQLLTTQLQHAEENLARRLADVTKQESLATAADAQLKFRVGEILGGPTQAGLVKKIEQVEEERNQALADVDGLRRKIHEARQVLGQLIRGNANLAKSLANPKPSANASVPSPVSSSANEAASSPKKN